MTQDSLHRFRLDLCLVHQPVAQRVTKVMKPEPLTIMDLYTGRFSSRTEMVSDKYGRGERNATFSLEGRKDKIAILPVGESGDTPPYAVEREIDDLRTLTREAGVTPFAVGISSGGALLLQAAASGVGVKKM